MLVLIVGWVVGAIVGMCLGWWLGYRTSERRWARIVRRRQGSGWDLVDEMRFYDPKSSN